ncbi:hypothetical protein AAE478_001637 [Parahypoxylon ruwenzoriense]
MKPILSYRPSWCQNFSRLSRPFINSVTTSLSATAATWPFLNRYSTLRYPDPPTSEHHDTASYAAYAARTGLDVTSNTYIGTQYEYTVADTLALLGFDVRRVGGRSDAGIDLLGTWRVPSSPLAPLRVLIQCKASSSQSTRIGPHFVRELEGAFIGAPPGWRGTGVIGLLVTQRPATKGIREALARSRWPMGYLSCTGDGRLEQMIWNHRAEEEGLEGMGVTVQFSELKGAADQRLVLTWEGKPYTLGKQPETSVSSESSA